MYPSIPHQAGLSALKEALENRLVRKKNPTKNLIQTAQFVLKNNLFEFNNKVFQQLSETATGTKFALLIHAFTWIELSMISLKHKNYNHCCDLLGSWTIFFSFGSWKGRIEKVYVEIYNFTPNLRFTYDSSEKSMSFLDLIITVSERKLKTTLHRKSTDRYECLHYASSHPEHT